MKRILLAFIAFSTLALKSYAACPGQNEIIVQITPDNYPGEISWNLKDQNNTIIASGYAVGDTICVPLNSCVTFTIYDSFGDGICCGYGNGSYTVYLDGSIVATGGNYNTQEATSFNCPPGTTCSSAIAATTGSFTAPNDDYWYVFTPTANGMYEISTCDPDNTCDTKIWVYDHCTNLIWNNTNQGTIYYDDNAGGCGSQAVVTAALDTNHTYYIRIGGNNGACTGNAIDFSITYNGPIVGCMDPSACNYNPMATVSSGTCLYWPDVNCPAGPDLTVVQSALESSLSWDQITAANCWVQESCLSGYGTRTIIRFTTHIKNIGSMDYYIGDPANNPGQFSFVNCHNHAHYEGYAEYVMYASTGQAIPIGFKNGFCVLDLECSGGGTAQYGCGNMGISSGCGDIYSSGLDCQWIDITDVDPGDYTLAVKVNWDQSPDALGRYESDYINNWAQVCINIYIDGLGNKNFTIDSNCPTFVDCAGTPYGNATIDCNGDCGGTAKMGDLDVNTTQDTVDAQLYCDGILDNTISAASCNDLNNDGTLTVWDAALITNCDNHGTQFNGKCNFPNGVVNPNHMVEFTIDTANFTDGYVDIYVRNPTAKLLAYEFDVSGITILNVLPLYSQTDYPTPIQYRAGGNKIMAISYIDSTIDKSTPFQPLCRVYYASITGTQICIGSVHHVVNNLYEATNTNIINGCVAVTGVDENSVDPNNYMIAWPNPGDGNLTVDVRTENNTNGKISVTNVLGEVIFTTSSSSNRLQLDFTNQPNGVYYINFLCEGKTITRRFVIAK